MQQEKLTALIIERLKNCDESMLDFVLKLLIESGY